MIKAYVKYWKKATKLDGYSSRADYWWVFLVNSIIYLILGVFHMFSLTPLIVEISRKAQSEGSQVNAEALRAQVLQAIQHPTGSLLVMQIVLALVGLIFLLPNISITARRLRDARMPWQLAFVFGLCGIFSIIGGFLTGNRLFASVDTLLTLIAFAIYILCLLPSRFGPDESDDNERNYD